MNILEANSSTETFILKQIEEQFVALYKQMNESGMSRTLAENGANLWLQSALKLAGRVSCLPYVIENERVLGFGFGSLRNLPPYLGGHKVGDWVYQYTIPEARKSGITKILEQYLEDWFWSKNATVVEAFSQIHNVPSQKLLEGLNFQKELLKYTKYSKS